MLMKQICLQFDGRHDIVFVPVCCVSVCVWVPYMEQTLELEWQLKSVSHVGRKPTCEIVLPIEKTFL